MSERKVLNKYFPPDFDPALIPRVRKGADFQHKITMMAPFNMRCVTCGEYVYKGKKFNATQETVLNEEYLGLRIFRFYIRCPHCSSTIFFKTDPKNADYTLEHGATRNFEVWKVKDNIEEGESVVVQEDSAMKVLEERTKESKQEMDILDALEEIKDSNDRLAKVDVESIISGMTKQTEEEIIAARKSLEDQENELIRNAFGTKIKRVEDLDEEVEASESTRKASEASEDDTAAKRKKIQRDESWNKSVGKLSTSRSSLVVKRVMAEPTPSPKSTTVSAPIPAPAPAAQSKGLAALGDYGSDSNSGEE